MSEMRISVLQSRDAIEAAICFDRSALVASAFQHPAWLNTWLSCFGGQASAQPFVVTVHDATTGDLLMMLPLVREPLWGLNVLRIWDQGVADYNAPVLAQGFLPSANDVHALWSAIARVIPKSDLVMLDKMPSHIDGRENPLLKLGRPGLSFNVRHALPLTHDSAPSTRGSADASKMRSLDRKRRKLVNKGVLGFRLTSGTEARVLLEQVLHWRDLRFADDGGARKRLRVGEFYKMLCIDADIARVGALTLDGSLIAGCFGTATGDSFQLLAMGFDEAYKNWSPGLLAVQSTIGAVQDAGLHVFDFTIGTAAYKFEFGAGVEPLYDLFMPQTLKGHAAALVRKAQVALQKRSRNRRMQATAVTTARKSARLDARVVHRGVFVQQTILAARRMLHFNLLSRPASSREE